MWCSELHSSVKVVLSEVWTMAISFFGGFSFPGITGSSIKMDQNGDSEGNFSVAALKPYHYVYNASMYNFTCEYFIRPVAGFQQGENPVSC